MSDPKLSDPKSPEPETFLPLSPAAFHFLVSLATSDKHGWAIMKDIERLTDGQIRLGTGTLYGLIKRLLKTELIAESDQRPPLQWDDERRRYYRLTELGKKVAIAEADRMTRALEVAASMKRVLDKPEPA